jgi:hypothetical protein
MKIVDKTPLLDEKGNLGLVQRIQGMLEYGFSWPRELEAQSAIIKYFDRELGKNYTLIRNMTLGTSGIMIPMIVLGPTGIYVIEVTHLKGRYEAKGESWNVESGDSYTPAPVNLIKQTMRMARALQAFIERQGVRLHVGIEPVLIAGDPGLHIESNRPAIKVMMIDGIKAFVSGLVGGNPALNSMQVNDFTDHILNPRPKQDMAPPPPEPEPDTAPRWEQSYGWSEQPAQAEPSRARAIFDAANEPQPFNPNDLGFAFEGDEGAQDIPPIPRAPEPIPQARPMKPAKPKQQQIMGMAPWQLAVIGGLALALLCIAATLTYLFAF